MLHPSETGWPAFLHWARKFYEMPDFDHEERDYKLEAVRHLAQARRGLLSGKDWVVDLERGFQNPYNNLVSHWQFVPFLDWVRDDRPAAANALSCLWTDEALVASRLDAFSERLPDHCLSGRGVRCNLGVYLLGAIDPVAWPNYKVTATSRAYELTHYPAPGTSVSMGGLYTHALEFFDRLVQEAAAAGLMLRDRLDAQGVMWSVVQWPDPPTNFTSEEWQELLGFRAIRPISTPTTPRPRRNPIPPHPVCPLCALDEEVRLLGPTADRWSYVCETGPGHQDPFEFWSS